MATGLRKKETWFACAWKERGVFNKEDDMAGFTPKTSAKRSSLDLSLTYSPSLPHSFFSPKVWTNPTQRAESRGKHNLRAEWDALSHLEHCAERQSCLPSHLPCLPTLHQVLIAFGGISPDWAGPKPQSLCAVTHTPDPRSPLWLWTSGGGAAVWIAGAYSTRVSSQLIGYWVELRLIDGAEVSKEDQLISTWGSKRGCWDTNEWIGRARRA